VFEQLEHLFKRFRSNTHTGYWWRRWSWETGECDAGLSRVLDWWTKERP